MCCPCTLPLSLCAAVFILCQYFKKVILIPELYADFANIEAELYASVKKTLSPLALFSR